MKYLVIDTSQKEGVVYLFENSSYESSFLGEKNQSKTLLPHIISLLEKKNLSLHDLDFIGVCIGPGSFTGTRIGVITAKSLSFGANIPLLPFNTLIGLANNDEIPLIPGSGNLAWTLTSGELTSIAYADLPSLPIATPSIEKCAPHLVGYSLREATQNPLIISEYLLTLFKKNNTSSPLTLSTLYTHAP